MNRYEVFVKVMECKSFTRAAEELNYTQSAVSQMIHTLEEELSTTLILRSKGGIELTADGMEYLPYIRSIANAHRELKVKNNEMQGLQGGVVRIGTFTSVSCNWLPSLMKEFKVQFPSVQFVLQQGEYTNIGQWIKEGSVDFGFINPDAVKGLTIKKLQKDEMVAILPPEHSLVNKESVSLLELAGEPYILLDEGEHSVPLAAFEQMGVKPNIEYKVYDDYSIMSMVEKGLGVSILYSLVVENHKKNYVIRPISTPVERTIAIAYKNKNTLPIASRYFLDFIIKEFEKRES
ncbi:MAG: LysR family transcriptional regulator [Velocimicrobium sp.]